MPRKKKPRKLGRPYLLTVIEHQDLIRRCAAGEHRGDLMARFGLKDLKTFYAYKTMDPAVRDDYCA